MEMFSLHIAVTENPFFLTIVSGETVLTVGPQTRQMQCGDCCSILSHSLCKKKNVCTCILCIRETVSGCTVEYCVVLL